MSEQLLEAALVAAQKELPKVEPDAINPHFKSKFVSLDHLIAKTRPVLNKNGLALTQYIAIIEGQPVLRSSLVHSSGARLELGEVPLILGKQDMQQLGAACSYARRYAWAAILGVSEQEDDDGNQVSVPARAPSGSTTGTPSGGAAKAGGGESRGSSAPVSSNFEKPKDTPVTKDTQKKLTEVFLTVQEKKLITAPQFLNACRSKGVEAKTWTDAVPKLSERDANELSDRLGRLARNSTATA